LVKQTMVNAARRRLDAERVANGQIAAVVAADR
jgi:hypothetical protein